MFGIVRYSVTIVAFLCAVALGGERAFGQVLQGRVVREAPNGDLFVADTMFNSLHVLHIPPGGANSVRDEVFASGLKQPFGIAFYPLGSEPRWVYVADSDGVVRFRYRNGQLKATGKPERIVAGIPTTHHYARDMIFSADGGRLDSAGLRNCEGMTVQPATGELWCDHTPFEYATPLQMVFYQAGNDAAKGRDLYIAHCSACHLANGEGVPGAFPPLKGSGVVNKDDAAKHIQVVLHGMQSARAGGVVYPAAMPPFAGLLSDAQIADIIDYERSSWGNHGTTVNAAQVAAERTRAQ